MEPSTNEEPMIKSSAGPEQLNDPSQIITSHENHDENLTGNSLFQTNANSVVQHNSEAFKGPNQFGNDELMAGFTEDAGDLDEYMYDLDIARRVEQDKLNAIHKAAEDLKFGLLKCGRCKICTLKPPCNHIKYALPDPQGDK